MIASTAKIHPSSIIEDGAVIGENVKIGPFCYIGPKVVLGDDMELMSHVVVAGRTTVGKGTKIFPNAVIGGDSQSVHHSTVDTILQIGDNCTIREGVTMNAGTVEYGGATIVGNNNLFLAYSHVAHDCRLGSNIIMSNNVLLAGHVTIEDRAILGGGCAVHQFTRIGRQAFIGGLSAVSYDVIPYGMLNGNPGVLSGLNVVGMTRAGIERATIHVVRRAYKQIFEGPESVRANAAAIRADYADCAPVVEILDFIAAESDRALSSPSRGKA
ncbi:MULTISPECIES: acyl-ACP--UDP-N-acetylglucosamine O-acyltransferase [Ensifer]|jgi:UDP-N-acetylglucosamine acyltransferase|uniref:Acyl-[acyl-carrier-protein]--UDP-N-acetylglucosamine O-acyltransferase n=1 Tax=Ensifer canadensis TaxID=555315 RepID=A0AAW4FB31_9HYPH|nr:MULTISPECIES: acyl-ACP--UDP-N-acetylglucosamine O-acyltransferase [Ensifer]AHK44245.1 acyl-[acyl-carrier-protein]--UDP-N- acetylglucosamine O-acyltransferase [Ensifer adhaerens OV14]MDP9629958.1 UDP-N-acetylglucosamine acyltransferase [Ensifer adhaerens]KQU96890.1 UDP-N-acetylglucosamine O-acyltransferase [Ensifer sp. Root31]KQW60876.1 UDP-N-acetylglucosamine O-acyltransferase [Ensifer sp. Root1252]KQW75419.1 UDP-N-acetylglucosamine O-acyltransferase [Ensifer sp. Root127]